MVSRAEVTATKIYVNLALPDTAAIVVAQVVDRWGCCGPSSFSPTRSATGIRVT